MNADEPKSISIGRVGRSIRRRFVDDRQKEGNDEEDKTLYRMPVVGSVNERSHYSLDSRPASLLETLHLIEFIWFVVEYFAAPFRIDRLNTVRSCHSHTHALA